MNGLQFMTHMGITFNVLVIMKFMVHSLGISVVSSLFSFITISETLPSSGE